MKMAEIDAAASRFLAELEPSGESVASFVPSMLESRIRILNPARDRSGETIRWKDSEAWPAIPRADSQWSNPRDGELSGDLVEPISGSIDTSVLQELFALLPMGADGLFFVAQWEGYADATYPPDALKRSFPPDRRSLVWSTKAADVACRGRVPMRWWHPELAWVVGNDIYARSIFLGGSKELISRVMISDRIETISVGRADRVGTEDL